MRDRLAKYKWSALAVGIVLLVVVAWAGLLAWDYKEYWWPEAIRLRDASVALLREIHPLFFFLILATLPVVPIPIMPFYAAAAIYPLHISIPGLLVSLTFNMAVSHWLGITWFRPMALRILRSTKFNLPQVTPRNERAVSVLLRVCGLPYSAQNYLSALAGVSFRTYLLVGVPVQVGSAIAIMLMGDALVRGRLTTLFAGAAMLVIIGLLASHMRKKLQKRKPNDARNLAAGEPGADSIAVD